MAANLDEMAELLLSLAGPPPSSTSSFSSKSSPSSSKTAEKDRHKTSLHFILNDGGAPQRVDGDRPASADHLKKKQQKRKRSTSTAAVGGDEAQEDGPLEGAGANASSPTTSTTTTTSSTRRPHQPVRKKKSEPSFPTSPSTATLRSSSPAGTARMSTTKRGAAARRNQRRHNDDEPPTTAFSEAAGCGSSPPATSPSSSSSSSSPSPTPLSSDRLGPGALAAAPRGSSQPTVDPGRDDGVSSNLATSSFGHVNVPTLSLPDTLRQRQSAERQPPLPWDWSHLGHPVGGHAGLDFLAPRPLQPASSWPPPPLPATTHYPLGPHGHVPTSVAIAAPFLHHPTPVVPSSAASPPLSSSLSPPTTPLGLSTAYGLPALGVAAPPPPAVPARPSPPLQAMMVAELVDAEEAVRRRQEHLQQQRELLLQQLGRGKAAAAAGGHRSRDRDSDHQQQLPASAAKRRSSRKPKQPAPGLDSPHTGRPARKTERKRSRSPAEATNRSEEDVERQLKRRPPSPSSRASPPPPPPPTSATSTASPAQPQLPSLHHFLRSLDVLPPPTATAHYPQALPSPSTLHRHPHPQQHQGDQAWPQQYHQADGGLRGFPLNHSLPLEHLPTTAMIGAGSAEAHRRRSVDLAALGRPWP